MEFACQGGKGDVEKIRQGTEKAEVVLTAVKKDDGAPLIIETSINRGGNVTCKVRFNNKIQPNPRTLLRQIISFGAFNPRALLDKKTREERILKLLPLRISEGDVVLTSGKKFPIKNWKAIPFEEHAWLALKAIKADLDLNRLSLYQEKQKLIKSHLQQNEELQQNRSAFFGAHGVEPEKIEGVEGLAEKAGAAQALAEQKKEAAEQLQAAADKLFREEETHRGHAETYEADADKLQGAIAEKQKELDGLKRLREGSLARAQAKKAAAEKCRADFKKESEAVSEAKAEAEKAEADYLALKGAQGTAREATLLKQKAASLKELEKEANLAKIKHEDMDDIIKNQFPILRRNTLSPIKQKLPDLDFQEIGGFTYKGVPLDTLSGSETVQLGMRLYALDKKGQFIFLNEAECLDQDSMKNVGNFAQKEGLQIVALRVADRPAGGEWKSTELKGE